MRQVDDFLIDRIFQPIADSLARWASCYAIAAFLLTGFTLAETVICVVFDQWITLVLSALWVPFLLMECYTLQRKSLCDVTPDNRIKLRTFRPLVLLLSVAGVPMAIFLEVNDLWYWLWIHDQWLLVIGVYFMACHMIPPRRQRQTAPHWVAASEVGET